MGTDYVNADGILCNDTCHEEWDKILEEMIFLFGEMNEESCKKKNPYEKELDRYRENCKNQAFTLFAKWFFYLWD